MAEMRDLPTFDWLDGHNAAYLARQIQLYWRKRGGIVETRVRPIDGHADMYCIESDLVNGQPARHKTPLHLIA